MKKKLKRYNLYFYLILSIIFTQGCETKISKSPFFDGLYLTYHEKIGTPPKVIERETTYKFRLLENNNFEIILTAYSKVGEGLTEKALVGPYSKESKGKLIIDQNGKIKEVIERFDVYAKGINIDIWLPENKRRKGVITFKFWKVKDCRHWRRWDVWVVSPLGMPITRYYYDVNTGFLVGKVLIFKKKVDYEFILVDTNAKIKL
jgi:hypothetical protein